MLWIHKTVCWTWFTASCSCVRRSAMLGWMGSTDRSAGPLRSRRPQPQTRTWTRSAARRSPRWGRSWRNTKTGSLSADAATLLLSKTWREAARRHSSLGFNKENELQTFLASNLLFDWSSKFINPLWETQDGTYLLSSSVWRLIGVR